MDRQLTNNITILFRVPYKNESPVQVRAGPAVMNLLPINSAYWFTIGFTLPLELRFPGRVELFELLTRVALKPPL